MKIYNEALIELDNLEEDFRFNISLKDLAYFLQMAKKIGLKTIEDVELFANREVGNDETLMGAMMRYYNEMNKWDEVNDNKSYDKQIEDGKVVVK